MYDIICILIHVNEFLNFNVKDIFIFEKMQCFIKQVLYQSFPVNFHEFTVF